MAARVNAPHVMPKRSPRHPDPSSRARTQLLWSAAPDQQYFGGTLACKDDAATVLEDARLSGDEAGVETAADAVLGSNSFHQGSSREEQVPHDSSESSGPHDNELTVH